MKKVNRNSNHFLGKRSDSDQVDSHYGFQNSITLGANLSQVDLPFQVIRKSQKNTIRSELSNKRKHQLRPQLGQHIKYEDHFYQHQSSTSTDCDSGEDLNVAENSNTADDCNPAKDKKRVNWSALNIYFFIFVVYNYKHLSKKTPSVPSGKRKSRQEPEFYNELLIYLERKTAEIRRSSDPLFGLREEHDPLQYNEVHKCWEFCDGTGNLIFDSDGLVEALKKKKEILYTRFDKREEESYEFAKRAEAAQLSGELSFLEPAQVSSVPPATEERLRQFLEQQFGSKFSKHKPMLDTTPIFSPDYDLVSQLGLATKVTFEVHHFLSAFKDSQLPTEATADWPLKTPGSCSDPPSLHHKIMIGDTCKCPLVQDIKRDCSLIMAQHQMEMGELKRLISNVITNYGLLDNHSDSNMLTSIREASEHTIRMCQDELILANYFVMFVKQRIIRNNRYINPELLYN